MPNKIQPKDITKYLNLGKFIEDNEQKNNATYQYEGIAGIINRLNKYNIALLADEVGMGKTFQALGVLSYYYQQKDKDKKESYKVLIITPNHTVMTQWVSEYKKFLSDILKQDCKDFLPPSDEKYINLTDNLEIGFGKAKNINLIKTSSFETNEDKAERIDECMKEIKNYDLVIVDEAHYYRNFDEKFEIENIQKNINNQKKINSFRVSNARKIFKEANNDLKILLLTATPMHKTDEDLQKIVSVFKPNDELKNKDSKKIMSKIMIRRLKVLVSGKNKYHYRREQALKCSLGDKENFKNELFFAMLQKRFIQKLGDYKDLSTSRYLLDFFEGIDYSLTTKNNQDKNEEDRSFDYIYQSVINDFKEEYKNEIPSNNKYKNVLNNILGDDDIVSNDEKALVFVRRKASAKNLVNEYCRKFDMEAWKKIFNSLNLSKKGNDKYLLNVPTRLEFNAIVNVNTKNEVDEEIEKESKQKYLIDFIELLEEKGLRQFLFNRNISKRINTEAIRIYLLYEYYNYCGHKFEKDPEKIKSYIEKYATRIKKLFDIEQEFSLRDLYSYFDYHDSIGYEIDQDIPLLEVMTFMKEKENDIDTKSLILDYFKEKKKQPSNDAVYFKKRFVNPKSSFFNFFMNDLINILYSKNSKEYKIWIDNKLLIRSAVLNASVGIIELYTVFLSAKKLYENFKNIIEQKINEFEFIKEIKDFIDNFDVFKKLSIEFKNGKDEENQRIFYGAAPAFSFTSENRKNTTVLDRFNSPFFPKLLCGTSTLQEGVNLQGFCDRVYHFGAAHTMGDDEQRIGRVDRMHSKFQRKLEIKDIEEKNLNIYYPYLEKTFDEHNLKIILFSKRNIEEKIDKCEYVSDSENDLQENNEDKQIFFHLNIQDILYDPRKEKKIFDNEAYGWLIKEENVSK